jgi:hypothetical protein
MTLLDQSLIDGVTLSRQAVADTIGKAGKFLGEESEWRVVSFNPRSDDTPTGVEACPDGNVIGCEARLPLLQTVEDAAQGGARSQTHRHSTPSPVPILGCRSAQKLSSTPLFGLAGLNSVPSHNVACNPETPSERDTPSNR